MITNAKDELIGQLFGDFNPVKLIWIKIITNHYFDSIIETETLYLSDGFSENQLDGLLDQLDFEYDPNSKDILIDGVILLDNGRIIKRVFGKNATYPYIAFQGWEYQLNFDVD